MSVRGDVRRGPGLVPQRGGPGCTHAGRPRAARGGRGDGVRVGVRVRVRVRVRVQVGRGGGEWEWERKCRVACIEGPG